ncbi:MAG: hypothetical protein ABIH03_05715 [Pseudomonadota bacterium]
MLKRLGSWVIDTDFVRYAELSYTDPKTGGKVLELKDGTRLPLLEGDAEALEDFLDEIEAQQRELHEAYLVGLMSLKMDPPSERREVVVT